MKKDDMYNGMTGIRSEYLDEADAYKAPKKIHWKRWIAAAACFCLLMCAAIPLFPGKDISSPFVVTAYAASPDDECMVEGILEKGKQIPISKVETSSGLVGFMFSHNKQDASAPTIAFMGSVPAYSEQEVNLSEEQVLDIEELLGHASDPTQAYFFFLPSDSAEPYTMPLMLHDEENNKVYQYEIKIVEKDGSYYAEIAEETVHDYKEQ